MTAWPGALPKPLLAGFQETTPNMTIRTQMDQGAAKVRRRTTAALRTVSFGLLLTTDLVSTIDSFFMTDTAGGVLSFDFEDPRTGATKTARFLSPPQYSPVGKGYWNAQVSLEYLP